MLVHLNKILSKAKKGGYAIGAFNVFNLETAKGVAQAAVAQKAPVIIQVSETTIEYAGLKPITHIVSTVAKNEAAEVPIVLHLDHGRTFYSVAECINAGFSSIMIDASDLPFDENVALTKKVADYAREYGVAVQGELGKLKDSTGKIKSAGRESFMTDPDQASEFVKKTGVDALAVSVGNIHGINKFYRGVPKLDLKRLESIHKKVKIPMVLHGASGISCGEIQKAIKLGIAIINIDTELRLAFSETFKKTMSKNPKEYDPRKILKPSIIALQKLTERKIKMFGSAGKI